MTSSTSVPDPERYRPSSSPPPQAQADQSSLPSPTTSKQGAGQLVRRLSGNALRDNKPPSIPQTPSGSGVEYVLNTLAAQATRSAPPHIRNFRVHHDPQGNAYTRSPEGTAMPLNSNHQLQLATSPTRSGGVHKPFKSPLVSPQASTETIIEQHPDTSAEEREREKQKAETAAKKEDEERQIREALALAEALQVEEKEEKVQEVSCNLSKTVKTPQLIAISSSLSSSRLEHLVNRWATTESISTPALTSILSRVRLDQLSHNN